MRCYHHNPSKTPHQKKQITNISPPHLPARNIIGHKKSISVYFKCTSEWSGHRITPDFRRLWTFQLAVDILWTLENLVKKEGVSEAEWSVWDSGEELSRCEFGLHWPDGVGGGRGRKGGGGSA